MEIRVRLGLVCALLVALTAGCAPVPPAATSTSTSLPPTDTPLPISTPELPATDAPEPTPTNTPTREPSLTAAPTATATSEPELDPTQPSPTTQPVASGDDSGAEPSYAPAEQQVWQLDREPFSTYTAPACPEPVQFNFYGLVAIGPAANGLTWQRQDGTTTLVRTSQNNYFGTWPDFIPDYHLNIGVSFTDYDSLVVAYTLVSQADANCQHTYQYRAAPAWQ